MASETKSVSEKTVSKDKEIAALEYSDTAAIYSVVGGEGLRLRVSKTKKTFIAKATINGKRCNLTLGNFVKKGVGAVEFGIRQAGNELETRKNSGSKPASTQKADFTTLEMYQGVGESEEKDELVGFHQTEIEGLASSEAVEQIFEKHILPTLGAVKVADVSHRQLTNLLAKISGPESRRKAYVYLKKFFAWAAPKAAIENPALELSAKTYAKKNKPRQRNLSREEVVLFHAALDNASRMDIRTKLGFKLLLLLGVRTAELRKAEWRHINRATQQWLIPAENTKTNEQLIVALPTQAVELFTRLKEETGDTGMVMGSYSDKAFVKAVTRLQTPNKKGVAALPFEKKITPHDLRRSASTFCNDLGIRSSVIEKMLNHAQPQMAAIYNRSDFWSLRMEAAQLYGNALDNPLEMLPARGGEFTQESAGFVSE